MAKVTMEAGIKTSLMVVEFVCGLMEKGTKVNGKTIKSMARVY